MQIEAYCTECMDIVEMEVLTLGTLEYFACSDCGHAPEDEKGEAFPTSEKERLLIYSKEWEKDRKGPKAADTEILEKLLDIYDDVKELQDNRQCPEGDCLCNRFIEVCESIGVLADELKGKIESDIEDFKGYINDEPDMEKAVREGYDLAISKLEEVLEDERLNVVINGQP